MSSISSTLASRGSSSQESSNPALKEKEPALSPLLNPSDSLDAPASLEGRNIAPVSLSDAEKNYLEQQERQKNLTAEQYLKAVLSRPVKFPGSDKKLYIEGFPEEKTREFFKAFHAAGTVSRNWPAWFDYFTEEAFYVPNDRTLHIGKKAIKKEIGGQIALVDADMTYETLTLFYHQNCVIFSNNNILKKAGARTETFINISTVWFNEEGKVIGEVDTLDEAPSTYRVISFFIQKFWNSLWCRPTD